MNQIWLGLIIAALGSAGCSSGHSSSLGGGGSGGSPGTGEAGKDSGANGGADAQGGGSGGKTGGTGGAAVALDGGAGTGGMPATGGADGSVAIDVTASDASLADAPAAGGPFSLSSSVFQDNGVIAPKYRCRTENVSPPLTWTPGPAGTQSYAITMNRNAALHWLLWDIPATTTTLPEAVSRLAMPPVPPGSKQNMTRIDGATWYGYTGPCPGGTTSGGSFVTYPFTVYALDVPTLPGVTPQSSSAQIKAAIDRATLPMGKATITAMAGGGK